MFRTTGNIWEIAQGETVVVPTNLTVKSGQLAVMGAGLAKEAAERLPGLQAEYGQFLLARKGSPVRANLFPFSADGVHVLCLPTKDHWRDAAIPTLIIRGLASLEERVRGSSSHFYVPLLGAGHGGLSAEESERLITEYLGSYHNVTLVTPEPEPAASAAVTLGDEIIRAVKDRTVMVAAGARADKTGGYTDAATNHLMRFAAGVIRREKPGVILSNAHHGWGLACARAALALTASGELSVPLVIVRGTADHGAKWTRTAQRVLDDVYQAAEDVITVHDQPYAKVGYRAHTDTDELMLDLALHGESARLVTLWDNEDGLTALARHAALHRGIPVGNYWRDFQATRPTGPLDLPSHLLTPGRAPAPRTHAA